MIRNVMEDTRGNHAPVGVVQDSERIGQITRRAVLAKLLDLQAGYA